MKRESEDTIGVFQLDPASPVPVAYLRVSAGAVIRVGRHHENDVVVADTRISRSHATVFHDGLEWHCAAFGANGLFSSET